jgi:hypothetical protein
VRPKNATERSSNCGVIEDPGGAVPIGGVDEE